MRKRKTFIWLTQKSFLIDYPRWFLEKELAWCTSQRWCNQLTKCQPYCCTIAIIILLVHDTTASPPRSLVSSQSHKSWLSRNRRSSTVLGSISKDSMASDLDELFYVSAENRCRWAVLLLSAKNEEKFFFFSAKINWRGCHEWVQNEFYDVRKKVLEGISGCFLTWIWCDGIKVVVGKWEM